MALFGQWSNVSTKRNKSKIGIHHHHHHHYHHHHHLSLDREGRWGTTDDFTTSFPHFSRFSIAPWDSVNSKPVHSLMLSFKAFQGEINTKKRTNEWTNELIDQLLDQINEQTNKQTNKQTNEQTNKQKKQKTKTKKKDFIVGSRDENRTLQYAQTILHKLFSSVWRPTSLIGRYLKHCLSFELSMHAKQHSHDQQRSSGRHENALPCVGSVVCKQQETPSKFVAE